jgi:hypothetical protein
MRGVTLAAASALIGLAVWAASEHSVSAEEAAYGWLPAPWTSSAIVNVVHISCSAGTSEIQA